ncbi:bacitracin ABC transporter ATP-binding protein [Paenibacillus sp. FSL R7-0273]|uniref:ABC transporter ATP-binding protein n=1 Tax=Paenibacillus sp. FSL R7-0273 TaxID=1536772 RepID=UPI0004F5EB5F|nr:ABC transporter ATP-binding protein [Paenibacillus sp. FSL R7-0273]AIQ48642.1 bacitracin ABC transporter ATP-binding protein [Paenibacillus sp. FSL R7-0273]OMF94013.1 bacitracin ABC transporter ATP-binding protein [Paenibacillus sp. FSL R7-0273]
MQNSIEVTGLQKVFGTTAAVRQLSFNVKRGEIFGLLGPSGSGKTTTIKILTGELTASAGDVNVLGFEPAQFGTAAFKSRIGILSDNSALYERLSIYDNLKLFCKLYDVPLNRIGEILSDVNLQNEGAKTVSRLSKGMKQRVLLAKALIHRPELVFLDEPTSALDPGNMAHIHRGLQRLNDAGTTIFLTTHNMEEATALCDRVAFLHDGGLQELDSPAALRYKYSTHAFHVETYTGDKLIIPNEPAQAEQIKELVAGGQIKTMHTDDPTLGQIFLKVTGKELE